MSHPVNSPALAPRRLSPWRQVGQAVDGCANAHEALAAAGLVGWNIRKQRQSASEITEHGVTSIENPEKVMLVRTDPRTGKTRYLSTVGKDYGIKQNEDQADVIDALVAESGANGLAQAGTLKDGRQTFVTMKLPTTIRLADVDPVEMYLETSNSHDGSMAFRVKVIPYRLICSNGLAVAISNKISEVTIRHTSKSEIKVEEIRSKLGLMYEYAEAFEAEASRMLETPMTTDEFRELIATVWPVDERHAPTRTRMNAERRGRELLTLWTSAETQATIRGTRWAGWQAVTEYLDHFAPAKTAEVRASRVLTSDSVAKRKQHAFDLLTA